MSFKNSLVSLALMGAAYSGLLMGCTSLMEIPKDTSKRSEENRSAELATDSAYKIVDEPEIYRRDTNSRISYDGSAGRVFLHYTPSNVGGGKLLEALSLHYEGDSGRNYHFSFLNSTNNLLVSVNAENKEKGREYLRGVLENLELLDERTPQIRIYVTGIVTFGDRTVDDKVKINIEDYINGDTGLASVANIILPGADILNPDRTNFGSNFSAVRIDDKYRVEGLVDLLESEGFVDRKIGSVILLENGSSGEISSSIERAFAKEIPLGNVVARTTDFKVIPTDFGIEVSARDGGRLQISPKGKIGSTSLEGAIQEEKINNDEFKIGSVVLNPHEEIYIAGFYRKSESNTRRGIPGTKNLPLIGSLLSGNDYRQSNDRFVIRLGFEYVE